MTLCHIQQIVEGLDKYIYGSSREQFLNLKIFSAFRSIYLSIDLFIYLSIPDLTDFQTLYKAEGLCHKSYWLLRLKWVGFMPVQKTVWSELNQKLLNWIWTLAGIDSVLELWPFWLGLECYNIQWEKLHLKEDKQGTSKI